MLDIKKYGIDEKNNLAGETDFEYNEKNLVVMITRTSHQFIDGKTREIKSVSYFDYDNLGRLIRTIQIERPVMIIPGIEPMVLGAECIYDDDGFMTTNHYIYKYRKGAGFQKDRLFNLDKKLDRTDEQYVKEEKRNEDVVPFRYSIGFHELPSPGNYRTLSIEMETAKEIIVGGLYNSIGYQRLYIEQSVKNDGKVIYKKEYSRSVLSADDYESLYDSLSEDIPKYYKEEKKKYAKAQE